MARSISSKKQEHLERENERRSNTPLIANAEQNAYSPDVVPCCTVCAVCACSAIAFCITFAQHFLTRSKLLTMHTSQPHINDVFFVFVYVASKKQQLTEPESRLIAYLHYAFAAFGRHSSVACNSRLVLDCWLNDGCIDWSGSRSAETNRIARSNCDLFAMARQPSTPQKRWQLPKVDALKTDIWAFDAREPKNGIAISTIHNSKKASSEQPNLGNDQQFSPLLLDETQKQPFFVTRLTKP